MPKTRLYNPDRDAITRAILAHRFDPVFATLDQAGNRLADEVRRRAYGAFLKTMESAPKGAFATTSAIRVNVAGKKIGLSFGPKAEERIFYAHQYGELLSLPDTDDLGQRVLANAEAKEAAKKERDTLKQTTRAMLENFTTFDALLEAWPEAERFITHRWRERGNYIANVPVIALKQLTEKLDLPPDEASSESEAA